MNKLLVLPRSLTERDKIAAKKITRVVEIKRPVNKYVELKRAA